jgi:hypothetical protein
VGRSDFCTVWVCCSYHAHCTLVDYSCVVVTGGDWTHQHVDCCTKQTERTMWSPGMLHYSLHTTLSGGVRRPPVHVVHVCMHSACTDHREVTSTLERRAKLQIETRVLLHICRLHATRSGFDGCDLIHD